MRQTREALIGACALALIGGIVAADDAPMPLAHLDGFLTYVAPLLQQRLPGYFVTPDLGQATLQIIDPDGAKAGHIAIRMDYEWCHETPANCPGIVSNWLKTAETAIRKRAAAPDPTEIQPLIALRSTLESEVAPRAPQAPAIVMRPFANDLVVAFVTESSDFPRFMTARDLEALNLNEDQALDIALQNLQKNLIPTADLPAPTHDRPIQFVALYAYEAARLLLASEWNGMAARCGGQLIVAVPAANLIAYSCDNAPHAADALRAFAAAATPGTLRPLGDSIFRLSKGQWVPVTFARPRKPALL